MSIQNVFSSNSVHEPVMMYVQTAQPGELDGECEEAFADLLAVAQENKRQAATELQETVATMQGVVARVTETFNTLSLNNDALQTTAITCTGQLRQVVDVRAAAEEALRAELEQMKARVVAAERDREEMRAQSEKQLAAVMRMHAERVAEAAMAHQTQLADLQRVHKTAITTLETSKDTAIAALDRELADMRRLHAIELTASREETRLAQGQVTRLTGELTATQNQLVAASQSIANYEIADAQRLATQQAATAAAAERQRQRRLR